MGFSKSYTSVEEERIVNLTRRIRNSKGCSMSKIVIASYNKKYQMCILDSGWPVRKSHLTAVFLLPYLFFLDDNMIVSHEETSYSYPVTSAIHTLKGSRYFSSMCSRLARNFTRI